MTGASTGASVDNVEKSNSWMIDGVSSLGAGACQGPGQSQGVEVRVRVRVRGLGLRSEVEVGVGVGVYDRASGWGSFRTWLSLYLES